MHKNPKDNPRKIMERAIEVMRESVGEARDDAKPNPLVGAVLLRSDGTTETACRGELREGNHAEFTLLERKCVGEKLDDCILFATLEPCLNRNEPKRGCARHIVSARIKKVYVGIDSLNSSERKGWDFMGTRTGTTQSEYARELGLTARTAQRHLTHFVELGLLKRLGSGPATEYLKP